MTDRRIIDVHTHMFTDEWVRLLKENPDPNVRIIPGNPHEVVDYRGAPIVRLSPEMTDFDLRMEAMERDRIDVSIISLTCPNVYWGSRELSIAAARQVNEDFAAAEKKYGQGIKWMASLPWEYPEDAVAELARAKAAGAIGVCLLTNILGRHLTDPDFEPIWTAIEESGLPAFIHPTTPFIDAATLGLEGFGLSNTVGFMMDTTACFARLILDGFMDRHPKLELIACHGGGTLPYLIARFDQMWKKSRSPQKVFAAPSSYLRRFWFDAIVYDNNALDLLVKQVGADRIMFGSDYPFLIADAEGVTQRLEKLPQEQQAPIFWQNAERLFGLSETNEAAAAAAQPIG
jgi:aminocarboxymuconate-semialdehyde decarboxylase